MRKLAVFAVLALVGLAQSVSAYSWKEFYGDISKDTQERFGTLNTGYALDYQENDDARNKFTASVRLISYKFISFDPAWVYATDKSNNKGEAAFSFPIHIGEIPLPGGKTIREAYIERHGKPESYGPLFDRLYWGPYFSHNFITEKFGYGIIVGIQLF